MFKESIMIPQKNKKIRRKKLKHKKKRKEKKVKMIHKIWRNLQTSKKFNLVINQFLEKDIFLKSRKTLYIVTVIIQFPILNLRNKIQS